MSSSPNETLEELPPSAKLVLKVLEHEGPLTKKQIADQSLLPPRTVRAALKRLDNTDLVEQEIYLPDARQSLYSLKHTETNPAPRPSKQS